MKIETMSREDLKELIREVIEEVFTQMSADSDGEMKPEVKRQILELRDRRQHNDLTMSADEVKQRLGIL
jgi:hypothetical protein